jgi:hypothetical protein
MGGVGSSLVAKQVDGRAEGAEDKGRCDNPKRAHLDMVMLEKPDDSHALQHDQRPAEFQDKLDARVSRGLAAGADCAHEAPVVVRGRTTVDEAYKVWEHRVSGATGCAGRVPVSNLGRFYSERGLLGSPAGELGQA